MRFDSAGKVQEVVWACRLAEMVRGENRVILNRIYNGAPPFDPATAEDNGIQINYNSLEGVNHLAQARRQWNRAFLGGGNYFNVTVDGTEPAHKRREWSSIITQNINKPLKRSAEYLDYHRANGANAILHGIAPSNWQSRTSPFLIPLMVDDLLVPSETLTSFRNLDHFAVYRQYSPAELYELTHGPKVDKGWNMPMVDGLLKAAAQEYVKNAYSIGYQYQPEKVEEYIKQDIGFWGSDAPPTIDVWDFYFREYEDGDGWYRRIVVDTAISSEARQAFIKSGTRPKFEPKDDFLYTSGKRKYANALREIIHCQFGDTSAVAPFRYHSVRSLGYMLYGVCELQNRLRCQFSQSVFEQLMWFFRVGGNEDFQRLKKALFSHMGVIPNGISFVPGNERFKPDYQMVALLLNQNQQLMGQSSASFTQDLYQGSESKEMTATETMARVNQVNALVSGMLNLAYGYETFQYRETCRRFCLKDSRHLIVKKFRKECLAAGVPEAILDVDRWNVEPERVLGAGNKQLEISQAQQLLSMRPTLSPQAQMAVDHIAIEAFTDDPGLAEQLVPMEGRPELSQSKQEAMHAIGTIMAGGIVQFGKEDNRRDVIETLLMEMALIVANAQSMGVPPEAPQIAGLQNLALHIEQLLPFVEADPSEQERAKSYADQLGKLSNIVKGWAQQMAQRMKAGAATNGNGAAETAAELQAKLEAQKIAAAAKAANSRESHAQKTAQRQVQFEQQQRQEDQSHEAEMRRTGQQAAIDNLNQSAKTAAEIEMERAKAAEKPAETD